MKDIPTIGFAALFMVLGLGLFQACSGMTEKGMIKEKGGAMMDKEEGAMVTHGSYEAYSPEKVAAAENKKVLLFFYAPWCPICRPLDANITANAMSIPKDILILKVNYDSEIALRQKYGVTVQHTIVEVDATGEMQKKWSVETPTLAALLASVK